MNNVVHFDIETIPSQESWVREYYVEKTPIPTPPKTYKKQETIDKWVSENTHEQAVEDSIAKAAFSGASNHICCISWVIDTHDGEGEVENSFILDNVKQERDMIEAFFDSISKLQYGAVFAGHNIIGFDIRVIKQRAMVIGIPIPPIFPIDAKPWDKTVYDTMLKWDSRDFIKMDLIAKAFGIDGKGAVDGSMVYPMWKEGKYEEIAMYCNDDVRMGRAVYNHMTFKK